ncbi:MAG TPA: hypothetical protein VGN12_15400 [Pirellulales bacterium]|jgi:DNA-3-methyladenine glycosylase II
MNTKTTKRPSIEQVLSDSDPQLGKVIQVVIAQVGVRRIPPTSDSDFQSLVRAILLQRVSSKGARTIFEALTKQARNRLTPARVLALPVSSFRSAGVSSTKGTYIRNISKWFANNPRLAKSLPKRSDDEIAAHLTQIPGVGRWTVNVFLIFQLQRLDVLPADDNGIRRGLQLAAGLKGIASPAQVAERAEQWRPYRSIASMYLWTAVKLGITARDLR